MNTLERKVDLLAEILLADNLHTRNEATNELKEILRCRCGCVSTSIGDQAETLLLEIGIPAAMGGFRDLKIAIEMMTENPCYHGHFVAGLYADVALKTGKGDTAARVERRMRHAIETAWDRGDEDILYKYFGNSVDPDRGRPTLREFIVRMADEASKRCRYD